MQTGWAKLVPNGLKQIQRSYPIIGDVRGLGLMVGVEFTELDGRPGSNISDNVKKRCLDDGLLLLQCGTYHQVIRWNPPLIVNQEQLTTAIEIFKKAVYLWIGLNKLIVRETRCFHAVFLLQQQ